MAKNQSWHAKVQGHYKQVVELKKSGCSLLCFMHMQFARKMQSDFALEHA